MPGERNKTTDGELPDVEEASELNEAANAAKIEMAEIGNVSDLAIAIAKRPENVAAIVLTLDVNGAISIGVGSQASEIAMAHIRDIAHDLQAAIRARFPQGVDKRNTGVFSDKEGN